MQSRFKSLLIAARTDDLWQKTEKKNTQNEENGVKRRPAQLPIACFVYL